jgi:hypothetical protein
MYLIIFFLSQFVLSAVLEPASNWGVLTIFVINGLIGWEFGAVVRSVVFSTIVAFIYSTVTCLAHYTFILWLFESVFDYWDGYQYEVYFTPMYVEVLAIPSVIVSVVMAGVLPVARSRKSVQ